MMMMVVSKSGVSHKTYHISYGALSTYRKNFIVRNKKRESRKYNFENEPERSKMQINVVIINNKNTNKLYE